jgi:hypothetical protein
VNLHSADFINEDRPLQWDFLNFGTVPFQLLGASGTWGSIYSIQKTLADNVQISEFTAWYADNSQTAATPGAIDSYGDFTDSYTSSHNGC